jgi:2-desacetyl-2-hydroxyethyl bacteriochlorophyllide A dehydrogenase
MRALIYVAPGSVEVQDRPRPAAGPGEKEIQIEMSGICGSDMSGFLGHSPRRKPPLTLGHELVGRSSDGLRVVANPLIVCGKCTRCLSGAQNLCERWRLLGLDRTEGSFAEYVTLPENQLYEIPDSLPSERAILAEPLANIVHMFRIVVPAPFFRLAIVGAGTMGALAFLVARLIGARDILSVDVNPERLSTLKKLGGVTAIDSSDPAALPEAMAAGKSDFDVVIDASGTAAARQTAFNLCRPGGQVVLMGMGAQKSEVDFVPSIRKEHRVVMSFAYTPVDFQRALGLLVAGEIDLAPWTEKLPLEEGQRAFEKMTRAPGPTLKMLLSVAS